MNQTAKPKVAIVYRNIPQYRRRFYDLLRARLADQGVELLLIYGQPGKKDSQKKDSVEIEWAHKIENKIIRVGSREVYWQPCVRLLGQADLVIVEQASKLLLNYLLLIYQLLGKKKLAFWGHGRNLQYAGGSILGFAAEYVKRAISRKVHWWFAYNRYSGEIVTRLGYPQERITLVQNSIDTRRLLEAKSNVHSTTLERMKQDIQLTGTNVCLYAGSMYAEKRLDFLIDACMIIKNAVPDFEMLFVGAGPDDIIVKEAANKHPWIRYIGPVFEDDKLPYFLLSKLLLMPGAVGLAVLDAFALETPLVTTSKQYHGPEIDYLVHNRNGIILPETTDPAAYAHEVIRLLQNERERQHLVNGCTESAAIYTVEEMADKFARGVLHALKKVESKRYVEGK